MHRQPAVDKLRNLQGAILLDKLPVNLYGLTMNARFERHKSETLLRVGQVAKLLGVSRQRLYEWARLGLLPGVISLGTRSNDRAVGYGFAESDLPKLMSVVERLKKGGRRR